MCTEQLLSPDSIISPNWRVKPFASPFVSTEIAKAIHHIVKHPNQAKEMIEQLFHTQATRLRENPFQMRQPLPPLPPLPEGVALPQALLPLLAQQTEEAQESSSIPGKE